MAVATGKKRNIAIISQGGVGKTSLAEAMLFNARATDRPGRVDDGSSNLDFEPEEHKRRITLKASLHHYEWAGHPVTIIDTPGYSGFMQETKNALSAVDGAVLVVSATSAVKVQTQEILKFSGQQGTPMVAFISMMDKERADFESAAREMEKALGLKAVRLAVPIGDGPGLRGIVDLLTRKAYIYRNDASGAYEAKDAAPEMTAEAEAMRQAAMETILEADDGLTEKYLDGKAVTDEELMAALRKGTLDRRFVPVVPGSSQRNIGVNMLLDAVNMCLPSPLDRGAKKALSRAVNPGEQAEFDVEPLEDRPFAGLVFKTAIDPYTGKLSFLRVYSGALGHESVLFNPSRGTREKAGHILVVEGKKTREVPRAIAGDIVAIPKLKDTHTGETLCDPSLAVAFPFPAPAASMLSYAVTPKSRADEDKVPVALHKLMEEDQTIEFKRDEETKEFLLSGTGQTHMEVSVERLKRKYGCEVELKSPRIPYKETIRSTVKAQGRYKKQSGGHGQYGDAWLEISPLKRGAGFEFVDAIVGGAVPRQYIPAVEKGVREAMHSGILAGYPVVDVRVKLYDGSYHVVDSSEMSFKIAASMGFKKGMEQARPVLLEPVMALEINVPDEYMGDCIGDINSRHGKILGVEPSGAGQVIKALVPMAEVITYATDLKGMTADRGAFTMGFSHYDEVPPVIAEKLIAKAQAQKTAADKEH